MPVFINEVVFRGDIHRSGEPHVEGSDPQAADPAVREALIAEVAQAVIEHLERELERLEER